MARIEEAEEGGRRWRTGLKAEWSCDQHDSGSRIELSYFSSSLRSRLRQCGGHRVRSLLVVRGDVLVTRIRNDHHLLCGGDHRGHIRGLHRRSAVHLLLVSPHLRRCKHRDVPRLSEQPVSVGVSASCDSQKAQMSLSIRSMWCLGDPARGYRRWLLEAELVTYGSPWWR